MAVVIEMSLQRLDGLTIRFIRISPNDAMGALQNPSHYSGGGILLALFRGCCRGAAERGMIFRGFDGLDGFLHRADTPVVEFAAGKLSSPDLGVEAGD
jgi:hypothetical protein